MRYSQKKKKIWGTKPPQKISTRAEGGFVIMLFLGPYLMYFNKLPFNHFLKKIYIALPHEQK